MAISIKKSSTPKQTVTSSSLPNEVQQQITSNTKLDTTDYTAPVATPVETAPAAQPSAAASAKGKRTDDVVQLKFSKGKRAEAKAFYALYDVKMNAGFEMAYEFLKEEVNAGNVRLSKSGIQRVKKSEE